jgi:hypothetical protein
MFVQVNLHMACAAQHWMKLSSPPSPSVHRSETPESGHSMTKDCIPSIPTPGEIRLSLPVPNAFCCASVRSCRQCSVSPFNRYLAMDRPPPPPSAANVAEFCTCDEHVRTTGIGGVIKLDLEVDLRYGARTISTYVYQIIQGIMTCLSALGLDPQLKAEAQWGME